MLREVTAPLKLGAFTVHQLSDGLFRLDGGAMYGTVPKTLWERQTPADDKNRIPLALGCLLIRTPRGKNVLVDAGLSSKYDGNAKFRSIYSVDRSVTLDQELAALGLGPGDIDVVINTHLHFDHAGGNTELDGGRPRPRFPKAKYLSQTLEWEDAQAPHERNKASYLEENFVPVQDAGQLELVDGDFRLEPGLKVFRSGGHTRGHQCVMIESEGKAAVFLGDLVPTRSHVPLPWIMGYDLLPVQTLEVKRGLLAQAKREGWILLFQHDVLRRSGVLREVDGRDALVPL
jgi:glyoxylase-like metal-dependent hydrolase (beta-lactamase superfamily II)